MFTIHQARCDNAGCSVVSFNHASFEPPICPGCGICARCGEEEEAHGESCPGECENCGELTIPEDRVEDHWGNIYCHACALDRGLVHVEAEDEDEQMPESLGDHGEIAIGGTFAGTGEGGEQDA